MIKTLNKLRNKRNLPTHDKYNIYGKPTYDILHGDRLKAECFPLKIGKDKDVHSHYFYSALYLEVLARAVRLGIQGLFNI